MLIMLITESLQEWQGMYNVIGVSVTLFHFAIKKSKEGERLNLHMLSLNAEMQNMHVCDIFSIKKQHEK